MRSLFHACLVLSGFACAESIEAPLADPKALLKVITAIESSNIESLTSQRFPGENSSYHLARIKLLGTVHRDAQNYSVAYAKFLRSRNPGTDTPPARGHGYLIILNGDYRIVSYGKFDEENYSMAGDSLIQGDWVIADFQANDEQTRHSGFIFGMLPYPFKNRISDEDWESGAFRKKQ